MYIIMIALHRAHELFVNYTFDHSVQNFLVSTLDISLLDVTGATSCYRGGSMNLAYGKADFTTSGFPLVPERFPKIPILSCILQSWGS